MSEDEYGMKKVVPVTFLNEVIQMDPFRRL